MAELVGANIATDRPGLAAGQAQVFDTSHLEKQIQDQIDQERKRQELQNQTDAAELNKIDVNGVRAADQKTVQKKYQNTYDNFRKLQLAQAKNDRQGAIQAQADLDRSKADLQSFIGGSKNQSQRDAVIYADWIHNRANYAPGATQGLKDAMNTPMDDPSYAEKSDISKYVVNPPKVDLQEFADKNAKNSVIPGQQKVVTEKGFHFDSKENKLSLPLLTKNIELGYTKDVATKDRIDEEYNPKNLKPGVKEALEQAVGHPLNTAQELFAADYYVSNHARYDLPERKQLTEHEKKPGATTINFGLGGDGTGAGNSVNVAEFGGYKNVPVINSATNKQRITADGKPVFNRVPIISNKVSSYTDNFTSAKPIRVDIPNSHSIRDASKGIALTGNGVQTLVGSQITPLPVYTSGPNAGNVVPDDEKDDAIKNGTASYRLMFHANQGNVVGMSADGSNFTFSKDPTPVYTPADNTVIKAILQSTSKDKLPSVQAKLMQLQQLAQKLNSGAKAQSTTSKTTPQTQQTGPVVKKHVKYNF